MKVRIEFQVEDMDRSYEDLLREFLLHFPSKETLEGGKTNERFSHGFIHELSEEGKSQISYDVAKMVSLSDSDYLVSDILNNYPYSVTKKGNGSLMVMFKDGSEALVVGVNEPCGKGYIVPLLEA